MKLNLRRIERLEAHPACTRRVAQDAHRQFWARFRDADPRHRVILDANAGFMARYPGGMPDVFKPGVDPQRRDSDFTAWLDLGRECAQRLLAYQNATGDRMPSARAG